MAVDESGRFVRDRRVHELLSPDIVLHRMLDGWRNQQLSRNLTFATIEQRQRVVVRFHVFTNEFPWRWQPAHVDEYFGDLRSEHQAARSTVRGYQQAISLFCLYVSDSSYGWVELCERLFGAHPVQVCHEWNTAAHVQDMESRPSLRPFARDELQAFFDRADDEVEIIARRRRKGWLAAYRDATVYKSAYAWGLRRNEVRHLQTVDFSRNPHAPEFARYGVLQVRYGKASRGSAPKRRSVLTVFDWAPDVVDDWVMQGFPQMPGDLDLFTGERGSLVSERALLRRFRRYCDDLDLPRGLVFHSLRRSYITHLIESGMDPRFVQEQAGHEYASTTAIYTSVSSDYRVTTLRRALDSTLKQALNTGDPTEQQGAQHQSEEF
ncbi:tyrosine-type recombinase/integrase [Gordonia rubripertincta]|uniref:Site-specific integrase n=1 Tax=Gordonia rubripertincta TaxID=36822 RepID=A0ABT4MUR7_GORRU|nr:site-specific integrase [Gordonia rubripertincta]MCZ4550745.1 site-specific integrase [Gordonia rubripertincta]